MELESGRTKNMLVHLAMKPTFLGFCEMKPQIAKITCIHYTWSKYEITLPAEL